MNTRLAFFVVALALPAAVCAATETYVLDPAHTIARFSVRVLGLSTVEGRFDQASGSIVLDRAAAEGAVEVTIATATVSTGDSRHAEVARWRDERLRSQDLFAVTEYPRMVFKSSRFQFNGDKVRSIDGTLTLRGVTRPVTLVATRFFCGTDPTRRKDVCEADLEASIRRSDFGMHFAVPVIGDEVRLSIAVEAHKH
jgi:polyisoprenoid-binding protein YceI